MKRWSIKDVEFLKQNYHKMPAHELSNKLGRSVGSIRIKAFHARISTPHTPIQDKQLHSVWYSMKRRCIDKNYTGYAFTGGRGITYTNEWETFKPFYEWAISSGYEKGLTIARKDINGNYTPDNCKWIPRKWQSRNRRMTLLNEQMVRAFLTAKYIECKSNQEVYKLFPTIPPNVLYNVIRRTNWKDVGKDLTGDK